MSEIGMALLGAGLIMRAKTNALRALLIICAGLSGATFALLGAVQP